MSDVVLVSKKLKHQCKLCKFCIISFHKNAVVVENFSKDFRRKFGCDKGNFKVTGVAGVVVNHVYVIDSVEQIGGMIDELQTS